ncbi:agmatinase [Mycolicibacterium smegmatis]|uniref:Agmatinase n=2 Tax=Mycolicibacterium smegmatis TaxID=1772 RepID=A0QRD0_MYCS2|nr:agmatinase [Mycolicibacterium smegmatis]ABK71425.1 agmatinase [Mycolicibacterium smegmatis MC2 155]AIU06322.1 agmatinase [Mycolicibacterium smegmatis MC2 155]AIU12947.1 agmatinase [Mycolicibacterium smegmatis]AIU19571.1 agmatinase [Mycolicibacterium smegmatis]MBE9618335.1 agmatinase [Mycolicibacterium smegmatis]
MEGQPYVRSASGKVGQVNATEVPRYAGIATFARLPQRFEVLDHDIAVVGVPFDSGVTYRPGARFGPSAIREASRLLKPYHPALDVSPFAQAQVVDAGDLGVNPFNIDEAVGQIRDGVTELLDRPDQRVVLLGGDHTIALPALQAMHAIHGPVALVHFDAHLDTWDTYFGAPCTHGTPFRRASEQGLIVKGHSAHVGIRGSLYDRADLLDDESLGFTVVHCRDIDRIGVDGVISRIHERVGEYPVYVSIDIDVLDPAFAPGTGTPEIGGMTSRELVAVLRAMRGLNIVGADIVEVAPAYDSGDVTAVAAANLAYELITLMADGF